MNTTSQSKHFLSCAIWFHNGGNGIDVECTCKSVSDLAWAQMNESMRHIQSLDRDASLKLAGHMWYVDSTIHIAECGFLRGIAEHRPYPEDAIAAFLEKIQTVREPNTLVASVDTQQFRYRWNGSLWARVN